MTSSKPALIALIAAGAQLVGTLVLLGLTWTEKVASMALDSHIQDLGLAVAFAAYSAVGALIVIRRPGNRVGWTLFVGGLCLQTWIFSSRYAVYGLIVEPGSLPGAELAAWMTEWIVVPGFGFAFMLLLLLFPDGHLPSRLWRPVAWFVIGAISVATFTWATSPGPNSIFDQLDNPVGFEPVGGIDSIAGWVLMVLGVLAAAVSLIVRYVRSDGLERRQIQWLAYAGALVFLAFLTVSIGSDFEPIQAVGGVLFLLAIAALPAAVGIAILRHRLYEIDRIINRTLVYAIVVGLLIGFYSLLVVGIPTLLGPNENGDLIVAGVTLATAFLFNPLRRRVQGIVDRRFYRSRYDTQQVADEFAARLRDQVDLDLLIEDWLGVIDETMKPQAARVWVRTSHHHL